MNSEFTVINYIRRREHGLFSTHRCRQLSLQQNLITNNDSKISTVRNDPTSSANNIKAFLIVMSIDKSFFAVATSQNSVGIYCSVSGDLVYNLTGSTSPIYTISWHPYFKNIIACSNVTGTVMLWDIFQSQKSECKYQKVWNWPSNSMITYSIKFHHFRSIMTLARDREIRFIDWEKGEHIAHWRFYSEFSWVPWVSWSIVGSSLIASVGNPQEDSELYSIIETINIDQKLLSPTQSGCVHYDNNSLCETCDTCEKMSMLDIAPPTFDEYRVNAVDLIRFVLSRNEEWFVMVYVCGDCRLRFKMWGDSIQLHSKYDTDSNINKRKTQLPHDVDSSCVVVMESPIAPEIVWNCLQKIDPNTVSDHRLKKYLLMKSEANLIAESKDLIRCIAMFERECLRQSICWSCIQQIHNWIMQQEDFPLFLYESMIQVRTIVMERVKNYDMNILPGANNIRPVPSKLSQSSSSKDTNDWTDNANFRNPSVSASSDINHVYSFEYKQVPYLMSKLHSMSYEDGCSNGYKDDRQKRLTHLHLALKFLQLYVAAPSKLGDLINILLTNNLTHSGMPFGPPLNGSKIDSYCIRKWLLKPIGTCSEKISPRSNATDSSNIIVPCLVLSVTGLAESSIRLSKCGRTVAVFVPHTAFQRLHSFSELDTDNRTGPGSRSVSRKRRHSLTFENELKFSSQNHSAFNVRSNGTSIDTNSGSNSSNSSNCQSPVIAIYSSEPESTCGQLLYHFQMPSLNAISLDFSPLGDYLVVGISGKSHNLLFHVPPHVLTLNSDFTFQSNPSSSLSFSSSSSPSSSSTLSPNGDSVPETHLSNIAVILKMHDKSSENFGTDQYENAELRSKRMVLHRIIRHMKNLSPQDSDGDFIGNHCPVNCAVWNTAGGLLFSRESGTILFLSFVG